MNTHYVDFYEGSYGPTFSVTKEFHGDNSMVFVGGQFDNREDALKFGKRFAKANHNTNVYVRGRKLEAVINGVDTPYYADVAVYLYDRYVPEYFIRRWIKIKGEIDIVIMKYVYDLFISEVNSLADELNYNTPMYEQAWNNCEFYAKKNLDKFSSLLDEIILK